MKKEDYLISLIVSDDLTLYYKRDIHYGYFWTNNPDLGTTFISIGRAGAKVKEAGLDGDPKVWIVKFVTTKEVISV